MSPLVGEVDGSSEQVLERLSRSEQLSLMLNPLVAANDQTAEPGYRARRGFLDTAVQTTNYVPRRAEPLAAGS